MEESVEQSKLKKELGEYIGRYKQERVIREETERELSNLKKRYAKASVPLTKAAVGYITNVISTARTAMGWGAAISIVGFMLMVGAGANAEAHGVEPLSPMYPIGALLSGIICLLITIFMPDERTTYDLINDYRNSQIASRLYVAGLLNEQEDDDDDDD